ncbi:MAG TPA: glutamate--tRNA ligase, partial [Nitrososphaera sp.]|nr:glutamate--tRNA ligase [Nitrososphaera sp.]
RLFFVRNPVSIRIDGAKEASLVLKNHPTDAALGTRQVSVGDEIFIAGDDAASLKVGDEVRLIEYCNIRIVGTSKDEISAVLAGDEIKQSMKKIQWVAKNDIVEYKILIPKELYIGEEYNTNSLEIANGFAETFASKLKPDTSVQFVRFGFCRIDGANAAIMTHR